MKFILSEVFEIVNNLAHILKEDIQDITTGIAEIFTAETD